MKYPEVFDLSDDELSIRVKYDYDRGEQQWFDAKAGVESPGYDPSVCITEVSINGSAWTTPDVYPQIDWDRYEQQVMERLIEWEADENAARDEAEFQHWCDQVTMWKEQA